MIQRIQSLYLLVATVLLVFGLFMNWATYVVDGAGFMLNGLECTVDGVSAMPLTLALSVGVLLLGVTLLGYKNRKIQMNLAVVAIVQIIVILGLFGFVHYTAIQSLKSIYTEDLTVGYGVAMVLPLIAIVVIWLARKAIKKDEELVKSVDRLR